MDKKYVYTFGNRQAEGNSSMKALLGGKGANLAEMNLIGIPVPPGFTITTEACNNYFKIGRDALVAQLEAQVKEGIIAVESITGHSFGDASNPLLLSVRSGARASMPGMMDTVLNLGMNDEVVEGFAKKTDNRWAAWDSYRRFIQMYGNVVMDMKPENQDEEDPFELIMDALKAEKGIELDTEFTVADLQLLCKRFREMIVQKTGHDFPQDPMQQLWGAILAVFSSWSNDRAIHYRRLNGIPADWGTAVNVQAMVFGNMGNDSATGVAFTRDPATGEHMFTGEYLINAQGEDVVAGTRTPRQITKTGAKRWGERTGMNEEERRSKYPSLEEVMPEMYAELFDAQMKLELHYSDMQDLEFTIQQGKLWILQTRVGKRTAEAMVRIGMEMLREGIISEETALLRMDPFKLDELLHPIFDAEALARTPSIAKGLPASPGAATGQIVFTADEAVRWTEEGHTVILVRQETSPEDIHGLEVAKGILTSRGGMTSHAAVVARGMGKCCVSGADMITIDYQKRTMSVGGTILREGDQLSLNGSTGLVYVGSIPTQDARMTGYFGQLMELADKHKALECRTNADTPKDAAVARDFGAVGIGLCRTEHMFFEEERLLPIREMIVAEDAESRQTALEKLLPFQRDDFEGIFRAMEGYPVTVRLLDPPLHEFLPHTNEAKEEMAKDLNISLEHVEELIEHHEEQNPMLGHRGCRLGVSVPEITKMQARAILEAAVNVRKEGVDVFPEIMVPLVGTLEELKNQKQIIKEVAAAVFKEKKRMIDFRIGTMIEVPRAVLIASELADIAEFFSFGTNDLTQMTFGYSRDDCGKFLPLYVEQGILPIDPFQSIDEKGVGQLVEMATKAGKMTAEKLHIGICGEHGGDPASIDFFHRTGLDYVSCSPYRVPIARLAAAQANLRNPRFLQKTTRGKTEMV